jgi:hypothetical protein
MQSIQPWIIMPTSRLKSFWNTAMIVLLLYTATYMPYQTCFIDEISPIMQLVDNVIDAFFMFDIVINFISAE